MALRGIAGHHRSLGGLTSVALAVYALCFVGFFGTHATNFDPALRLVTAVAYGIPVVVLATACLARGRHPLDLPVLGLLAVYAAVSLLSTERTASLETVALTVCYAGFFLVMLRVPAGSARQGLVVGAAFAVTCWLAFAAFRWVADAITWIGVDGTIPPLAARSGFVWLSTDAVAALALLGAPFYLHIERRSIRHVFGVVSLVAAAIAVPLSGGRVEWLGMLVACIVYVLLDQRRYARTMWVAAGAILATAALAGLALAVSGGLGTLSGRFFIWATAAAVVENHPLVGAGPGTFSWVRLAEAPDLLNRYPVYHAHNLVLQLLVDGGVALMAAFLALCMLYAWRVVPRARSLAPASRAGLASLAGFGVILMLDELTQIPALACLAIGSAALAAREALPMEDTTRSRTSELPRRWLLPRWAPAAAFSAIIVLSLPAAASAQVARTWASAGRGAALAGDWSAARTAFAHAVDAWPARGLYRMSLGLAHAHLGESDEAKAQYLAAHQAAPGDPRPLGALAILDEEGNAVALLRQASRLGTMDPQYPYRLALRLKGEGDTLAAHAALASAGLIDGQLVVGPDIEESEFVPDSVAGAMRKTLEVEAPLAGIRPESVEASIGLALGRIPDDPVHGAIGLARHGRLAEALARIEAHLRDKPHDRAARAVAWHLEMLACDTHGARRHRDSLNLLPGGYAALYLPWPEPREARDHVYRELGLGDYQPPGGEALPVYPPQWPAAYLPGSSCESAR